MNVRFYDILGFIVLIFGCFYTPVFGLIIFYVLGAILTTLFISDEVANNGLTKYDVVFNFILFPIGLGIFFYKKQRKSYDNK